MAVVTTVKMDALTAQLSRYEDEFGFPTRELPKRLADDPSLCGSDAVRDWMGIYEVAMLATDPARDSRYA